MDNWFLMDTKGAIVGPLGKDVAVSLLRERPGLFVKVSRDGVSWSGLRHDLRTQALVGAEAPEAKQRREEQEAQKVLFELDRFKELTPNQLFGVPASASRRDFRQGFLNLAKRFHPARLAKDVHPALLRAHLLTYQYLSEVIQQVEASLPPDAPTVAPTIAPSPVPFASPSSPVPFASPSSPVPFSSPSPRPSQPPFPPSSRPTPSPGKAQPMWPLDALKLKPQPNQSLLGSLAVTPETSFVFTGHRLMNLQSCNGVFFPCMPTLALGTRLELAFEFADVNKVVSARGSVVLESTFSDERHLRGFGVQLENLKTEDKGFILRESQRLGGRR